MGWLDRATYPDCNGLDRLNSARGLPLRSYCLQEVAAMRRLRYIG